MFGTFKKNAISEEIAARVLALIQQGQLSPGSKLPPERELAEMMQVSRPSLREALRALSIMNIIEIRQGDGTYVSSLEPDLLVEHLDFVFSINDSAIIELFEARRIVEVGLAAMAAQRITDEDIDKLEVCLARSTETVEDPAAFMVADIELHQLIIETARNPFLKRFMTSIYHLSRASRMRTMEIPGIREQAAQDHKMIVQALKARDPEQARQAMLEHLNNIESKLLSLTDQAQEAEQLSSEVLLD
jgi:GntR family transcriptional repressor for pyruvate dehydrogenase complex